MVLANGVQRFHLSSYFTLQTENKMVKVQISVGFHWTLNMNERTNCDNLILAKSYLAPHHKMLFNTSKTFMFWSALIDMLCLKVRWRKPVYWSSHEIVNYLVINKVFPVVVCRIEICSKWHSPLAFILLIFYTSVFPTPFLLTEQD